MTRLVSLSAAHSLPFWRRPITLLFVASAAMPVAFATWSALLNNFVIAVAGFDGSSNMRNGAGRSVFNYPGGIIGTTPAFYQNR